MQFIVIKFALFQGGQLSITGESMCTKYWFIAKEVKASPGKMLLA